LICSPANEAGLDVTPSSPARRASPSIAVRVSVPRARIGVSLPPFPAPTHKAAKRGVFMWSTALFIFAGVLGGLALYQTATPLVPVTADSTPGSMPMFDIPVRPRSNDGSNAIDIGRPPTDGTVNIPSVYGGTVYANPPFSKNIDRSREALIERARTVMAVGDIEAVRAALSRLIEGGNASAAVDLGSTYDPNILDALGVRSFPADVTKARVWYQMAQQMGAPEAVGLLESLESSERRSR
jgi:hypothetical protein